jgi:Leucine-rich repeat (LRR) protein
VPAREAMLRDFSSLRPTEPDVSAVVYKLPRGLPILLGSIFRKLNHLDISGASVVALPYDLAERTPALSTLNAGFNELVSVENCKLPGQLRFFFLHGNKLNAVSTNMLELPTLEMINLDNNHLTTFSLPRGIDLRHITSLNLNGNRIGHLPPEIRWLESLTALSLKKNQLEQVPDSICFLSKVEILHLTSNLLTSLPSKLGALTALRVLNVARNRLASLPPSIGGLVSLKQLRVEEQRPSELVKLDLRGEVGNVGLADQTDQAVKTEVHLGERGPTVELAGESVGQHGQGVRAPPTLEIDRAPGLVSDSTVKPLPQIEGGRAPGQTPRSDQGGNGVPLSPEQGVFDLGPEFESRAFSLPDRIIGGSLDQLELLSCFRNRLEEIPTWACRLQALKELNLSDNLLKRLPQIAPGGGELGLPALERLLLEKNRLIELPDWLENSPRCRTLIVAQNLLTVLPTAIGYMIKLEVLDLSGNKNLLFPEPSTVQQGLAAVQVALRNERTRPTAKSLVRQVWERSYGLLAVLALFLALSLVRGVSASPDHVGGAFTADDLPSVLGSVVWAGVMLGVVLALSCMAALTAAVAASGSAALGALGVSAAPVNVTAATSAAGTSTAAPAVAAGMAAPVASGTGPLIGKGVAMVADVPGPASGRAPEPPWGITLQSRICEELSRKLPNWESATSCWLFGNSSTAMPRGVGDPVAPTKLFGKEAITRGVLRVRLF